MLAEPERVPRHSLPIGVFAARVPENQADPTFQQVVTGNQKKSKVLQLTRIIKRLEKRTGNGKSSHSHVSLLDELSRAFTRTAHPENSDEIFLLRKQNYKIFVSVEPTPSNLRKLQVTLDTGAGSNFLREH